MTNQSNQPDHPPIDFYKLVYDHERIIAQILWEPGKIIVLCNNMKEGSSIMDVFGSDWFIAENNQWIIYKDNEWVMGRTHTYYAGTYEHFVTRYSYREDYHIQVRHVPISELPELPSFAYRLDKTCDDPPYSFRKRG